MPSSDPARAERQRLLEAILRLAAERGYGAAAAADVAARAGLPEAAFGRHFASREECFLAALDAAGDVLFARVSAAYEEAAGEEWPVRVVAALRALLELLAEEAGVARVAMLDAPSVGEDARLRQRRALQRFVPLLEEGRRRSDQGEELPPDTAQFAIGGGASLIFDEVRAGRGPELAAILPALTFAVLMPYLGAEAAEREMERGR